MHRSIRWFARHFLTASARLEFDLMSASQDLATNVAALQKSAAAYQAAVQAKLAEPAGDDPSVVAANTAIVSVTDSLNAAASTLAPGAPPESPTPAA